MRIGIDIDGVLADFYSAYENECVFVDHGIDRFPQRNSSSYPSLYPPVWNWPEHYGYSDDVVSEVWKRISNDENFWYDLNQLCTGEEASMVVALAANINHDVYFITARPGKYAKRQTEGWLTDVLGIYEPTVLLSDLKGYSCRALNIELYIDDKGENILNVEQVSPDTKSILLSRPYNTDFNVNCRADTLKDALRWVG